MTEPLYPPRWMRRLEAARWVGMSPTKFDQLVKDGRLPAPKTIDGLVLWDRYRLDAALELLPDRGGAASDDDWQVAV
jgi:predicted DNA-binding transcriptional regulator AlpA